MGNTSSLRELTEHVWEQHADAPLEDWVRTRIAEGQSWRKISTELAVKTGGLVDLPVQTLINWFKDDAKDVA